MLTGKKLQLKLENILTTRVSSATEPNNYTKLY
jgi:hypothetical protein